MGIGPCEVELAPIGKILCAFGQAAWLDGKIERLGANLTHSTT